MTQQSDPLEAILGALQGVKQTGEVQWEARCPAHDDDHASLSISRGNDGRALLHCHAGCSVMQICQAAGIRLRDLFATREHRQAGQIVATYDYRNAQGELVYQVVRYDPKGFRHRRPDGSGGWIWKLGDTPRILYHLPELLAADDGWVFVCEGEKDCDSVAALGLAVTTNPGGAGSWSKLSDDSALYDKHVVILPDKDGPGRSHAEDVARRLYGKAAEIRIVEIPGEAKDVSDWLAAGGTTETLIELIEATAPFAVPIFTKAPSPEKAPIMIGTDEHRVIAETVQALAADDGLYQRGGVLVRVLRNNPPDDDIRRPVGSPTIQALPAANLRERMTRCASFLKFNSKGDEVPAHPPNWLVSGVDARQDWPGIRQLYGISDAPVFRPDGSVWQTPGYDRQTGVFYQPGQDFPPVEEAPPVEAIKAALETLLEIVCDFRFEAEEHKAAWLAALLTPLARFAFDGPSPLFLIDANVRGAGKGLLGQTIAQIVLGRGMPTSSYVGDPEEMRKRITSIAIAGDRMILLDNLEGAFGNDALDRALTSTRWQDRILGKSEQIDLPLSAVWYATGNNVTVNADTTRRVIHIRLDVLEEHPEQRSDFRHPNLIAWVTENRPGLLSATLTLLVGYCRAGRPEQGLGEYGSFEGWSRLVRQTVVWLGLPDPYKTKAGLESISDATTDLLADLLAAWEQYDPWGQGIIVSEMIGELYPADRQHAPTDNTSLTMKAALEALTNCPAGRAPTPRQVGNQLRRVRRRVFHGRYLDLGAERQKRGVNWILKTVAPSDKIGKIGVSGVSGVSVPAGRQLNTPGNP